MYPRTITLESPKLKVILEEKAKLVEQGRFKSEEVEIEEKEMERINLELVADEAKVDITDFKGEQEVITNRLNEVVKEMDTLTKRIYERMKEHTNPALRIAYDKALAKKQELEAERNKIAMKIQQKNDKAIPIGQKLMKPFIKDEFEDYDSLRIENGKIVATIFSHLEDFKKRHNSKAKK